MSRHSEVIEIDKFHFKENFSQNLKSFTSCLPLCPQDSLIVPTSRNIFGIHSKEPIQKLNPNNVVGKMKSIGVVEWKEHKPQQNMISVRDEASSPIKIEQQEEVTEDLSVMTAESQMDDRLKGVY